MIFVVRVQPGHDFTCGPFETLVYSFLLAIVRPALPAGEIFLVLPDNLDGIVRAPAVHDDIFKVRIVLAEHRVDALFQKFPLVERWGYYGNFWKFSQTVYLSSLIQSVMRVPAAAILIFRNTNFM